MYCINTRAGLEKGIVFKRDAEQLSFAMYSHPEETTAKLVTWSRLEKFLLFISLPFSAYVLSLLF